MKKLILIIQLLTFLNIYWGQIAVTSKKHDQQIINQSGYNQDNLSIGNSYIVKSLDIDANIKSQVADVRVTQTIYNPSNRDMEVELFFPLPNNGIVQNLVMMVNGEEVPGELMKKEEAQQIYQQIVSRKKDPALMQYAGYGLFKTSVFPMAIGEEREISIKYTQLCKRKLDNIGFSYPLGTQQFSSKALESITFHAVIESSRGINNIYSPSNEIEVQQITDNKVDVRFQSNFTVPKNDFRLFYTLQDKEIGATVLSYHPDQNKDGYFMLMASPSLEAATEDISNKNILFVLDKSGSMAGKKIEQSKKALSFVMNNLNEGDLFNIITYDDRVNLYKEENQLYSSSAKREALHYVSTISSGGGTNINDALIRSMKLFSDNENPNYIIFLTDGLPTSGEKNEMLISKNVTSANKLGARIFAFGVGNDVNARLLDRLTANNGGLSTYVKPHEDIESTVAELYNNISSPVMTDIKIRFSNTDIRSTYPDKLPDLFKGSQLIWVGKYNKPGKSTITLTGRIGGVQKTFSYDVYLESHEDLGNNDYIEKIWASRRVGFLIDQIDLNGQQKEWIDELVSLSKEHGILTPYTAFLAREDMFLADQDLLIEESADELEMLNETVGESANELRIQKKEFATSIKANAGDSDSVSYKDKDGNTNNIDNIRKIGSKTFYEYEGAWVESTINEKEIEKAIAVKKFSNEYFKISNNQKASFNQYLSDKEEIVVRLDQKIYRFIN